MHTSKIRIMPDTVPYDYGIKPIQGSEKKQAGAFPSTLRLSPQLHFTLIAIAHFIRGSFRKFALSLSTHHISVIMPFSQWFVKHELLLLSSYLFINYGIDPVKSINDNRWEHIHAGTC